MKKAEYLNKFKVGNPNEDHYVADQVFQYFGKRLAFPRIMVMIKQHGRHFILQTLLEMKSYSPKNPVALFLWKVKQNTIQWKSTP